MTYPNGRELTFGYGANGSADNAISRIGSIIDDDASSTHLVDYSYLGAGDFVISDYTEPDVMWTMVGTAGGDDPSTGDIYHGLDRFGRIKDNYWRDYGGASDVDRIKYGYDRNGNRLWRENDVARSLGKDFDEKYMYDLIDRLKDMGRGELDANDNLTNKNFEQCWGLDATCNWKDFLEDDNGNGTWSLNQQRESNKVNEITNITETVGASWSTPAFSKAGNMTTVPMPDDPTQSFTATYDAWNRLVKLEDSSAVVAEYEYDGAKRRTIKKTYTTGVLDETRHLYYTEPSKWQVIEERVDTSNAPERQFVWGERYIDEIILRDRDTTSDGLLNERLYSLQDANWNVTALINNLAAVQERFAYQAYGNTEILTPAFSDRTTSTYNWETTYAGYRLDLESQLFCVRNRFLHTTLGQWLQRDPIGYVDGYNLFEYARSSPLSLVDPSGHFVPYVFFGAIILTLLIGLFLKYFVNAPHPCVPLTPQERRAIESDLVDLRNCLQKVTGSYGDLQYMRIGQRITGWQALDANAITWGTFGTRTDFSKNYFARTQCQRYRTLLWEGHRVGGNFTEEGDFQAYSDLQKATDDVFRELACCLECCHDTNPPLSRTDPAGCC